MSSVAEQLRAARESQSLTVHQVAEFTKIRTDHIRALEEGNYNIFAAPVYIRGFVRSYGGMLKLDSAKLLEDLDAELQKNDKFRDAHGVSKKRKGPLDFLMLKLSQVRWRMAIWIIGISALLLGAMGGYQAWRNYMEKDPLADLTPALYKPPSSNHAIVLPIDPLEPSETQP